jgi:hypothetical protein
VAHKKQFNTIVSLNKRNHRYCGPTESSRIRERLIERIAGLKSLCAEMSSINDSIDEIANVLTLPSGSQHSVYDLRDEVHNLEGNLINKIHIKTK